MSAPKRRGKKHTKLIGSSVIITYHQSPYQQAINPCADMVWKKNERNCAEQTHAHTNRYRALGSDNEINYAFFGRFCFCWKNQNVSKDDNGPTKKKPLVLWVYLIRYSFFVVVVAKWTLSGMFFNTPMYYTKANTVPNRREKKYWKYCCTSTCHNENNTHYPLAPYVE